MAIASVWSEMMAKDQKVLYTFKSDKSRQCQLTVIRPVKSMGNRQCDDPDGTSAAENLLLCL